MVLSTFEKPAVRQTILSVCVSMSFFCIGLVRGYSSPAIPSIMETFPELLPSKNIASWAGSIAPLGAMFGSMTAFPMLHFFGRKYTLLLASPLWTIAWISIATAQYWQVVILGRILSGFCVGLCLPSAQIYVTESADPAIRGILGSLPSIFMSLGILFAFILGSMIKWDILAWSFSTCAVSLSLVIYFLPDSPIWLRSKNRHHEADHSAEWLKLQEKTINLPVPATSNIATVESMQEKPTQREIDRANENSFRVIFTRPVFLPLSIGLVLLIIQQVSGIDTIIFFTVEIFRASGSSINEHLASIIVGFVQLASNIASLFVVDRSGRKPLLIISAVVMCISTASMGVAFYLNDHGIHEYGFLPLTSLIVFMIGFSVGFGCIPFLLMGELFPSAQRSLLSSIAGTFNLGVMFIVIKTYHYLEYLITTAGTFWVYSVFCAFGVIFVIAFVPETKGRDLNSIAKLFVKEEKNISNANTVAAAAEGHSTADIGISQTTDLRVPNKLGIDCGVPNAINENGSNIKPASSQNVPSISETTKF